ncbi:CHASE2 domain-containing protein [Paraburkholderia franconis]|uniref:CHASE2 domain-containing protein n=1 Tax=Paraburkholderia franconis TaxID=2654983 RepID=UPI00128DE0A3|nr:adenylate/guanylate cyclase domain-containing protein [Paraburkholderia franconis]
MTALLSVLLATGWQPEPYERLAFTLDDWRQGHTKAQRPDTRVTLVDIDEHSLDVIGPWPWPRALIARLAQTLFDRFHAKTVGLDILFPEASNPKDDEALLTIARHYPLVFAQAFDLSHNRVAARAGHVGAPRDPVTVPWNPPVATGFVGNFFEDPAVCTGHVTPIAEFDGVVRAMPPVIRYAGTLYPMFGWQMLHCADHVPSHGQSVASLPVDSRGTVRIPFRHGSQSFDAIPALQVLTGAAPVDLLRERYVIVGSSALGLTDHIATPVDAWLPAAVVHAEMLTWLLDAQMGGTYASGSALLPLAWTAVTIVLFAVLFRRSRALTTLLALVMTISAWLAVALLTPLVAADLIALPLVPVAMFIIVQAPVEWISSQATLRSFEQRFSRYLPPTVVREIVRRHGLTAFQPERRHISVLFVDIEGYTRLAEQMTPEQLVAMTELVLTRLTCCVRDTEGTLDKYIGDAIMAFWGAPLEQADHPDRAMDCALAMLEELKALNNAQEPLLAGQMVRARIGINTGSAVVGELGSTTRQSYTAIGDAINVASRLQDYAKVAGTDLLVGEETAKAVTRHNLRPYAQATLRGRVAPEMLYVLSEDTAVLAKHG